MSDFQIESTRGGTVESVHVVSVAVVDSVGRLVAQAGDPNLVTFWRSAAKPFQSLPLVLDGAADRWELSDEHLALACASHSSEPPHLEVCDAFLRRVGVDESALACGPHAPLSAAVAERVLRAGTALTPKWSNCSGKHTGMLALARHHGWPAAGYEREGHPVQARVLHEVARWTGVPAERIALGVDGCTAVCFGLPLVAMAQAYARFATSDEPGPARLRRAMTSHPMLVAGTGRLCTDLMSAGGGEIIAKVGAEGVYGAALPSLGLGIALKVEDGDRDCVGIALLAVLRQLLDRLEPALGTRLDAPDVARHAELTIVNTRGAATGGLSPRGALRFVAVGRTRSTRAGSSSEVD